MSRPTYDTREKLQEYIDKNITENGMIQLLNLGITSLDGIKFPEKTTYIYLYGNPLARLHNASLPPNLRMMQFIHNQIATLDGVAFPPKLTGLQLQGNQITSLDVIVFPPGLTSLDLSNNKITSFAGMQFPLSLLSLNLAGNPIDVETVSQLKNPSPFVIREIVAAFPETAQHFKRTEEMKEQQFEQLRRMMSQLIPMIEEREQTVPAFSATTEQGETHTIPFIPEKTVQWAIDYLNNGPLSGKCGKMTLFYNSTPLDPLKPLADSGIADNSTLYIQCDGPKGGRKRRSNKTRRYGRAHRQKSYKNR
jgi:Leucine rich repeat